MRNPSLKALNLSSEELKEIVQLPARKRSIKDYKSMPEVALILSKPAKKVKSQK